MIKVKLIEKKKDKSGDTKREVKMEKEIKKSKDYKTFISELSKVFSIPKNKFILKVWTEDEDEYPINNQEDLNSYLEEAKEFLIIMEDGLEKTKSTKKKKKKKRRIVILIKMMTKMIMIVIKIKMKKRKMKRKEKKKE